MAYDDEKYEDETMKLYQILDWKLRHKCLVLGDFRDGAGNNDNWIDSI